MGIKQVIVVRTHYPDGKGGTFKPRTGKLMAQAAHASMKVFFDRIDRPTGPVLPTTITISLDSAMAHWVFGTFTKVVVGCKSEEDLHTLMALACEAGLPCAIIQDCGFTEFHGVPTWTAVAIGPARAEDIDPVTGHLPLL